MNARFARVSMIVSLGIAVACGSNGPNGFGSDGGSDGTVGDASGDGPSFNIQDGSTAGLTVQPPSATLLYKGSPVTQQFTALSDNQPVSGVQWSVDNFQIGSIDASGLFTASGGVGGTATVTATKGSATGTGTVLVQLQVSANPGNVPSNIITQLQAGGTSDASFKWLYPYDKTLWPRGLSGPVLQFAGTATTYAWLHVETTSQSIVYDAYYGASSPSRIDLSNDPIWTTIGLSTAPNEDVTVSVTKMSGATVTGPISEKWNFAPGSLKGTVYYNSYTSQLANGYGAVLKIKPGLGAAPSLIAGGTAGKCTVCHTVSSNGNVMYAANNGYGTGAKYDLLNGAAQSQSRNDYVYEFTATNPDGSIVVMTTSDKLGGMWQANPVAIYDGAGNKLTTTGLEGLVQYAATPSFSPDGKLLAFNDEHTAGEGSPSANNQIDMLSFDPNAKTFSNLVTLVKDTTTVNLLGWPSFTPDGKFVFYDHHQGESSSGVSIQPNYGTWGGQRSALEMVDVSTKQVYPINALNGLDTSNQPYLPFGADDENRNFEPNVLPLAAGGYFWVVFTSRRQYGNTINSAETGTYGQDVRKKLWVSAVDINPTPGKDPTHVPFYLPGQEVTAGNMRGFWVLDPCKQNGNSCDSGDECCGGYCRQVSEPDGGTSNVCVPPPNGCSHEYEKCSTSGDCCDTGAQCINGFCALPTPH
ncbi:MAG TPA: hypothetical protein VGH28_31180 [Polyangiaceae bacterium]|jgi:hypothetical protein